MMFSKILKYIKSFLFVSVPEEYQSDFSIAISKINVTRAKITAITFITLEALQLSISVFMKRDFFLRKPDSYYGIMYVLMLVSMAVFLLIFFKLGKNVPEHRKSIQGTGIIFTVFVLLWCVGISLLDQLSSGQIIVYAVAMMATAVTPFFKPVTLLLIYMPTYMAFLVLMPYFQKSPDMIFGNCINSTTFLIFSWVISCMRYKNQAEDFNNRNIIQEKNKELKTVNKDLEEANHKLEKLSQTDSLAGIFNRYAFDMVLKTEWDNCKRNNTCLSLIMIDIDFFKAFNDNYGHLAEDYCIKEVAKALSFCTKNSSATVARYGGDEFAIILPDVEQEKALELAEHLRSKVEELAIPHEYSDVSKHLTISLGVHFTIPAWNTTMEEFIRAADNALYEAKKERRNNIASA